MFTVGRLLVFVAKWKVKLVMCWGPLCPLTVICQRWSRDCWVSPWLNGQSGVKSRQLVEPLDINDWGQTRFDLINLWTEYWPGRTVSLPGEWGQGRVEGRGQTSQPCSLPACPPALSPCSSHLEYDQHVVTSRPSVTEEILIFSLVGWSHGVYCVL